MAKRSIKPKRDDYGAHAPPWIVQQIYGAMNHLYKWGYVGQRLFGRVFWLERLLCGNGHDVVDVERFGLRWRLRRFGNVSESRLLRRPDAFEVEEVSTVLSMASGDFVFVDIGANCGYWSLRIANKLDGCGVVLAIEPQPDVLRRLQHNAKINGISNIEYFNCAVGARAGHAMLEVDHRNLGRSRISDKGSLRVEVRSLLDIIRGEGLKHVDAIKVDVEGYEDRVLKPFLQEAPAVLLPTVIIAEISWSASWDKDWFMSGKERGYRELKRTRNHNVILVRDLE